MFSRRVPTAGRTILIALQGERKQQADRLQGELVPECPEFFFNSYCVPTTFELHVFERRILEQTCNDFLLNWNSLSNEARIVKFFHLGWFGLIPAHSNLVWWGHNLYSPVKFCDFFILALPPIYSP